MRHDLDKKRWSDPSYVEEAQRCLAQLAQASQVEPMIDLRGASLGNDSALPHLALIDGHDFRNIDVSRGRGVIVLHGATVTALLAARFHFDRATAFFNSEIVDSSFSHCSGRYTAEDVTFRNCDFSHSTFMGGNEYGFRRCRFESCDFTDIRWQNTFLRVCEFLDCTFSGALIGSLVVAAKFFGTIPDWESLFAGANIESVFIEGAKIQGNGKA